MRRGLWVAVVGTMAVACGGTSDPPSFSVATASPVRGAARIDGVSAHGSMRVGEGATVAAGEAGRVRLELDGGPRLLLDRAATVSVVDGEHLLLEEGRLFAEVAAGEVLSIHAPNGELRASDAAFSLESSEAGTRAYVIRGRLSWTHGRARGVTGAGAEVALIGEGDSATAAETATTLWDDWTGGLAEPRAASVGMARGVGALEARVPGEVGLARWPLVIRRLDVRVRVERDLAITEVEQTFFNPASEIVEGIYRVRVPEGAVLQRFAVNRGDRLVDGYVRERQLARREYQRRVYRGSNEDPALLEWDAPGQYRARLYPIVGGETRRVLIRYAEWLGPGSGDGARTYRYPMGASSHPPRIQELSIEVDLANAEADEVRAGLGARRSGDIIHLRRSDFAPRADFWLELDRNEPQPQRAWHAPHRAPLSGPSAGATPTRVNERDYFYLPLTLPASLARDEPSDGVDLVILADVSAATDGAELELGRSTIESIAAHLGERDRIAIMGADLTLRPVDEHSASLEHATPERIETLLDGLARMPAGGASDLGQALQAAAAILSADRPGAIVYVGDGAPTVGEIGASELLERMGRLPRPVRVYATAIGDASNLDLLSAITRGGGLAMRVRDHGEAAGAAMDILAHLSHPVLHRVTVSLGDGIENTFPRRPMEAVAGSVFPVVGRVRGSLPTEVTVRGEFDGRAFERRIPITSEESADTVDLRLRWAHERLRQLMMDGASREEIAELGTRYGLITPFTSYYVPSRTELQVLGSAALELIDRRGLRPRHRRLSRAARWTAAVLLGPASLLGCTFSGSDEASRSEPVSAAAQASQEGERGQLEQAELEAPPPAEEPRAAPGSPVFAAADQSTSRAASSEETVSRPPLPLGATPDGYGSGADPGIPASAVIEAEPSTGAVAVEGVSAGAVTNRAAPRRSRTGGQPASRTRAGETGTEALLAGLTDTDTPDQAEGDRDNNRGDGDVLNDATAGRHAMSTCSDAAQLPLADRAAVWAERLGAESSPDAWWSVYQDAIGRCEAPSWRARRMLLGKVLAVAGRVDAMTRFYRRVRGEGARRFLRGRILQRVRTPDDLRIARNTFGFGRELNAMLVDQILERAPSDDAKVQALRRLVSQHPRSFELKLRLLTLLESTDRPDEARRLADRMRTDPMADPTVRTAIGEMLLRMGRTDDARRVFSEIVEFAPLDEVARRRLGDLYRAHGWYQDAYRQYQTLSEIRPDDPGVLLLLAQAAAGAGRVDEALRLEQRLMQTAQPGALRGIARTALLWTSVRFARLKHAAAGDVERERALGRRQRQSGVLRHAGAVRVNLVWTHPDARLRLLAGHPGEPAVRPADIAPEFGIETFQAETIEAGEYTIEVRHAADVESQAEVTAQLIVVWNEGQPDERIQIEELRLGRQRDRYRWSLTESGITRRSQGVSR